MNVLHHDNGVVDENADGEDEREQRNAVQREPPRPGGEERSGERDDDRSTHHQCFASPHGQHHQQDYAGGGEEQLLNELLGFVVRGNAVVAGHCHLHVVGNDGAAQGVDALHDTRGDIDGVLARFFRHGESHCRGIVDSRQGAVLTPGTGAEPHISVGLVRGGTDAT